MYMLTEIMRRR